MSNQRSVTAIEQEAGLPAPADFLDFEDKDHKRSAGTLTNARVALRKLETQGMEFSYDVFRDKRLAGGVALANSVGQISDEAISGLRVLIRDKFNFDPGKNNMWDAANLFCREHSYHPVRDYLKGLGEFFGKPQLETWMIKYLGVDDTPLTRYVSKMVLVASVRRIMRPGCKYDYMIVLEGPENKGKSLALATLYGDEFFSDQTLLGLGDKELQEATEGRWCVECAELVGMKKDVEKIKTQITRQVDRARKAYARAVLDFLRQCVLWGTTNERDYLRSQTGNRRFIPVRVSAMIDIEGLRAARDSLWAEAVEAEAAGFPITMPEHLWDAARAEQELRTRQDPWRDKLADIGQGIKEDNAEHKFNGATVFERRTRDDGHMVERCTSQWLLGSILEIPLTQQNPELASRLRTVMEKLGWRLSEKTMWIGGRATRGYVREFEPTGI